MKKGILFIFLFFVSSIYSQNQPVKQRSTNEILKLSNDYLTKALWFQEIPQYNSDSSDYYFEKSKKLLNSNAPLYGLELAHVYYYKSNFYSLNTTLSTLDSLASIGWLHFEKTVKRKENQQFEYEYLRNWSFIKREKGENKKSLELFSKAILIANDFKTEELQAKVFYDKGSFYQRNKVASEQKYALGYLMKSCRFYEKKGPKKNAMELSNVYASLIGYYTDRNVDSIFYYSDKMQSILKYLKKPNQHAWYYVSYGRDLITYPLNGAITIPAEQYNKGKAYIIKALAILEKYNIQKSTIKPYAYGLLADLYMNEKKYDLAIINYQKSYQKYSLIKNSRSASDINLYIAKAYHKKGDLATALKYYTMYFEKTLHFEKEINEKGLRESELKVNLLQQEKKISRKQTQQVIGIVILIIALLLLALLFWNFKQKQKSNIQLAELNEDLANKNNLLDTKNAENELLLREIHHRVKNNLEVVSSLLALQSAQIDDLNTREAMTEGQNRVNSIGIVHQKLYQGTNLGAVEMKDYFLNLSESIIDSFGAEKRVDLLLAMETLDLDIDTAVPLGLIVNELLTNCIKYAFPKGEKGLITIKLAKQDNHILHLEVTDNGVGKSGITHGTGFGCQLVSLLTQQLNGIMTEKNQNGTTLIFDFKLKQSA